MSRRGGAEMRSNDSLCGNNDLLCGNNDLFMACFRLVLGLCGKCAKYNPYLHEKLTNLTQKHEQTTI